MMSKPSSPLKKVKVKSFFAKKNKNKENSENSPSSSTTAGVNNEENKSATANSSTHGSTKSEDVSGSSELDTPILSNSAKTLNENGSKFPTIPSLMSDDVNDHTNDDDDDDSVAAMSDIGERQTSLDNNISWNDSDVNDEEYYKQDYYTNTGVDVEKSTVVAAADGGEANNSANNIGFVGDVPYGVVEGNESFSSTADEGNQSGVVSMSADGIDISASAVFLGEDAAKDVDNITTPRRDNTGSTTAAEVRSNATPTNTPGSKVSFCDDETSFSSPPHLQRIDVFATPTSADASLPITPLEELKTPGGSTNAPKVLKQNKKLRAGRKELLKILGSTVKQFRVYEEVASGKIFELEERIRNMEKDQQHESTAIEDRIDEADVALAVENGVEEVTAADAPDASNTNSIDDQSKYELESNALKSISSEEERAERPSNDQETVRNLSNELIEQQQQDCRKEKLISSLKLRCETLKVCLSKMEDELDQKRKVWENEVDLLSDALDKNNEALDHSVAQLEKLRKWRTEQDQKEEELRAVCKPMQSNEEEKPSATQENDEVPKESEPDSKSEAAMKELELTIVEKEQQIETLEGSLNEKGLEIVQLQTDLDSCFKEIEALKELVNKTAAAKGFEDFQNIVDDLQDEAIKSESKATAYKERISELESELQAKNSTIEQLIVSIEEGKKSSVEQDESDSEASLPATDNPAECNLEVESKSSHDSSEHSNDVYDPIDNIKSSLLLSPANDSGGMSSPGSSSPGASPNGRWTGGLSFARKLAKEGRQYAAAVGNANDPESMLGMIRERDRKINSLEATIETNTLMIEKLTKDVERMDTEHEEALMQSCQTIKQLTEESAVYLQQVEGFEKAFMTLNESQQTTIIPSLDEDEAKTPDDSVASDKDDEGSSEEDPEDLSSQNSKLKRMLTELREESSFQEDQIEKMKTELTTLRVVSQQEKESACDKLRDENKIMEAQRFALENELVEINNSAAMLRNSLGQDSTSPSKFSNVGDEQVPDDGQAGSNPILVAQVVMLENANKVLESSVDSLRSDQQEKLAPLLERIALLEEEKRIMEEEMHTKIHCREQTISNLEDSLKQATQSRLTKKKKSSALELPE
mmetsp:Transcript_23564/g.35728  ORF Transcript_23564/g.35728 Transcript_23564/m.35728 type:complete len:1105 (-) Transcript_23564:252-3566(-)|eukprot:scaffold8671_cov112-Skeletonema_dohrnii-CCMP3373.AAC.4